MKSLIYYQSSLCTSLSKTVLAVVLTRPPLKKDGLKKIKKEEAFMPPHL